MEVCNFEYLGQHCLSIGGCQFGYKIYIYYFKKVLVFVLKNLRLRTYINLAPKGMEFKHLAIGFSVNFGAFAHNQQ